MPARPAPTSDHASTTGRGTAPRSLWRDEDIETFSQRDDSVHQTWTYTFTLPNPVDTVTAAVTAAATAVADACKRRYSGKQETDTPSQGSKIRYGSALYWVEDEGLKGSSPENQGVIERVEACDPSRVHIDVLTAVRTLTRLNETLDEIRFNVATLGDPGAILSDDTVSGL